MLNVALVDKYTLWFPLYPAGVAERSPPRKNRARNEASPTSMARGGCYTCGQVGHIFARKIVGRGTGDTKEQYRVRNENVISVKDRAILSEIFARAQHKTGARSSLKLR